MMQKLEARTASLKLTKIGHVDRVIAEQAAKKGLKVGKRNGYSKIT